MSASVSHSVARSSVLGQRIVDQRPVATAGGAGVGGNTVAQLLQENCAASVAGWLANVAKVLSFWPGRRSAGLPSALA